MADAPPPGPTHISVNLRVKPSSCPSGYFYTADGAGDADGGEVLRWEPPAAAADAGADGAAARGGAHEFRFDRIFGAGASQADVFDSVGRGAVLHALDGYNATRRAVCPPPRRRSAARSCRGRRDRTRGGRRRRAA